VLAVLQPQLDSSTFGWCVPPLPIHSRINISYNMVTKMKTKLTRSKIGIHITFHRDMMLKIPIYLSIPLWTQEPLPWVCPNQKSYWWLAVEGNAGVKAVECNRLLSHSWWWIGLHGWRIQGYSCVWLCFSRTYPSMTTFNSRSPLRNLL
jgi:hypothetical protein